MRRLATILTAAATVAAALTAVPAQAATLPSPPTTGYAFFTAPRPGVDWGTRFQPPPPSPARQSRGAA